MCNFVENYVKILSEPEIGWNIDLMRHNHHIAGLNRVRFETAEVCCLNLLGNAGSGKTTLLVKSLAMLSGSLNVAILECKRRAGVAAHSRPVQNGHDAGLSLGSIYPVHVDIVARGLAELDLAEFDLLFIENVADLRYPAEYPLGEQANVILISLTEGEAKPLPHPALFQEADCVVITKTDLAPYVNIDLPRLVANIQCRRPDLPIFTVSAETGDGMLAWVGWVHAQVALAKKASLIRS